MTPKVVMFNMDIGENTKPIEQTSDGKNSDPNHNKIDDMIKELSTSLWSVKNEQEYMQVICSCNIMYLNLLNCVEFLIKSKYFIYRLEIEIIELSVKAQILV